MKSFLHRLTPKSLSGQLIGLIVVGIVLAQAVSVWVFHDERRVALAEVARGNILLRSTAMAKLIEDTPPNIHERILDAGRSRFSAFWIADTPVAEPHRQTKTEARLLAMLHEQFNGPREILLDLDRKRPDRDDDDKAEDGRNGLFDKDPRDWDEKDREKFRKYRKSHKDLALSIQMNDGRWFNVTTDYRPPDRPILPFLMQLALTILIASLVVWFLMRRVSRPLSELATSAERLGRGEKVEPLKAEGPLEIQSLTHAFNDMQDRLTRFVRDRTRMLAAISHDLRTPITSLRLRAEFIEDDENREKVIETLDEMSQMTEATLAFARDEATGENAQKLDLGSLLTSLADDQQDLGKSVECQDSGRLVISCRPVSLKRAMRNIIENGVRYGEAVCVTYGKVEGHAVIRITDRGPGIPEERLKDVFEPFVRLEESRSEETGGIGLGLAISRSIIHAHGGTIALTNRKEGGLEAKISLPLGDT